MVSRNTDTIWKVEPHTIAKITILESYLVAWFQILGRSMRNQNLIYVDGFAGPGKYTNYSKGSPIAALIAAKSALSIAGQSWVARDIHCVFIESDKQRFEHLKEHIKPFDGIEKLKIHLYESAFVNGLNALEIDFPNIFEYNVPNFVFIDPFGATGAPFETVENILVKKNSEVLINFDADGIARIFKARSDANSETLLNEIFKKDTWYARFSGVMTFQRFCREILQLYIDTLRGIPNVRYVFPFEMRKSSQKLNYFLIFASQHPLGLEKMKEAMKKVDQSGDYRFSDAAVGQESLFRFDQPEIYAKNLFQEFTGKQVQYEDTRDYALNHTPFINPKLMLKCLEDDNLILVISSDPKRRKGTFNEDKIQYIEFK